MTIVESNSVLRFLRPTLAISVLDPTVEDFKPSALRYLDRADALVIPEGTTIGEGWAGVSPQLVRGKPQFTFRAPAYCPPGLVAYVRERLQATMAGSGRAEESPGLPAGS